MLKFISEFGPLIAFFLGYKQGGIQMATLYMLITAIVSLSAVYFMEKKVQSFSLISTGLLLISATITLASGNSMFIKMKPTILYIIFTSVFIYGAIKRKPLLKYMLGKAIILDNENWIKLGIRFGVFFFTMALLNEVIWRNFGEEFWVKFKVFGSLPITIVFILSQVPFMSKHNLSQ